MEKVMMQNFSIHLALHGILKTKYYTYVTHTITKSRKLMLIRLILAVLNFSINLMNQVDAALIQQEIYT